MAEVIVQAKIEAVIASNRIHKVVRDPEGEKRVKDDLKARLWAETEKRSDPQVGIRQPLSGEAPGLCRLHGRGLCGE